MNLSMSEVSTL